MYGVHTFDLPPWGSQGTLGCVFRINFEIQGLYVINIANQVKTTSGVSAMQEQTKETRWLSMEQMDIEFGAMKSQSWRESGNKLLENHTPDPTK